MSQGSNPSYAYNDAGSASNILANIIKQQYSAYQAQFVPEENKEINYATDPNTIPNAQKRAIGLTNQAFQAEGAGVNKQLETSGVMLTPDQKAQVQRQTQTSQGLSLADNANRAGSRAYDTVTSVLSGSQGAPSVPAGGGAPGLTG